MNWPTSQDYNEAIQNAATCLSDPALRGGEPTLNSIGLPVPRSGNFADVYQFKGGDGNWWALKCFTRHVPGLRERYAKIDEYLAAAKLPFTVGFNYLEEGIRIRGRWYPILKMEWVEGFTLNEFVRRNADKPSYLHALMQMWAKLTAKLREARIAHADLQHGNVLLVPGNTPTKLGLKLIDYDGIWAPPLAASPSGEVGHPNFQHPLRLKERLFNADVDRFPHLVVACALRATVVGGRAFWDRFDNGDNLLFREQDLRDPANAEIFKAAWGLGDNVLRALIGHLAIAGAQPLPQTVWLDHLLFQENGPGLSRDDENRVVRMLGVARPVATQAVPAAAATIHDEFSQFRIFDDDDQGSPASAEANSPATMRQSSRPRRKSNALLISGAVVLALAAALVAAVLVMRNSTVSNKAEKGPVPEQTEAADSTPKRKKPVVAKHDDSVSPKSKEWKIGAGIDGYRWEFRCVFPMAANPRPGMDCASALVNGDPRATDNFTEERKFEGEKGKSYNVTLRFRGVVEPMTYTGGKADGEYFYIGGAPSNPNHNIFRLSVSSPPSHYFLNRQDRVGPRTFMIDYTKTIRIDGHSVIAFHGNGQDGKMIANYGKIVVPDIPPAPQPFNGQFIQVNVVDVAELNEVETPPSDSPKTQVKDTPRPFQFDRSDPIWLELLAAKNAYRAKMDEYHKKALKYFQEREDKAEKNSNAKERDQVIADRREYLKQYEEKGEMSRAAPFDVRQNVPVARVAMENAFELAAKAYFKANKEKELDAVRQELRDFKRTNAVQIGDKR